MLQLATVVLLICLVGYGQSSKCFNSLECDANTCCRSTSGAVLGSEQQGPFGTLGKSGQTGTCSQGLAQKGEVCDGHCRCDSGLACYRPMSGVCCPARRCYDAEYVKKQQAYWATCAPPHCFLPP